MNCFPGPCKKEKSAASSQESKPLAPGRCFPADPDRRARAGKTRAGGRRPHGAPRTEPGALHPRPEPRPGTVTPPLRPRGHPHREGSGDRRRGAKGLWVPTQEKRTSRQLPQEQGEKRAGSPERPESDGRPRRRGAAGPPGGAVPPRKRRRSSDSVLLPRRRASQARAQRPGRGTPGRSARARRRLNQLASVHLPECPSVASAFDALIYAALFKKNSPKGQTEN